MPILYGIKPSYCMLYRNRNHFVNHIITACFNNFSNVNSPLAILDIVVWDENTMSNDAFIGKASVPLLELCDQNQTQRWLKLKKRTEKDNVSGEIQVSMTYKYLPVYDHEVPLLIFTSGMGCVV